MMSAFRRLTKSRFGPAFAILFLLAIGASFALADVSSLNLGGGASPGVLATVGDEQITETDMSEVLQRELARLREQNPEATYADLAPQYDDILNGLIQQRTLTAYAAEHGLTPSKTLIDQELVKIPGVRGLDGRFSEDAYRSFLAQNRLTDAQIRGEIATMILQKLILAPVGANARIPVGVARPYASMLLERRQGQVALVPASAFADTRAPTDAELQQFYAQNRQRYQVPEQRVLRIARLGPEQVANVAPTDQEIAAYYNANRATYAGTETRALSRASVPDQAQANQIAQRARAGGTFAAAAQPAGFTAADVSLGPQTREQLASLAGPQVAAQVFGAADGAVIGPVQSSTGWDVIKIEGIRRTAGRPLAEARTEIAERLTAEKRKNALTDLVTKIEDQVADGQSFTEVAAANRLTVTQTPPIIADGSSRRDANFRFPSEYRDRVLKDGFELAPTDDPVVEQLPGELGFALLSVGEVIPSAPAPLAQIRDRVAADFVARRALDRARAAANQLVAKVNAGTSLADAWRQAGIEGPAPAPLDVRRMQLSQVQGEVPAPLQMLFSLAPGKARLVAAPQNGGYFIVRLDKITAGDALSQPQLVAQVQTEFNQAASQEYAQQFLAAAQAGLGVDRKEDAIAAARKRLLGTAG